MKNKKHLNTGQFGFTLIELALALIVIGLLTSAYIQLLEIKQRENAGKLENYKAFTIADGLAKFQSQNGHYPCPARLDRKPSDPDFGDPQTNIDPVTGDVNCNDTVVAVDTFTNGYSVREAGGQRVRIGMVPYKEIGVGKEDIIDIHGNYYSYAVVEAHASETGPFLDPEIDPSNHVISVLDYRFDSTSLVPETGIYTSGNDNPRSVDLLFYSHGKDGVGSHTQNGTPNLSTCSNAVDTTTNVGQENCDDDLVFVTERYAARSNNAGGQFDDSLVYSLVQWIDLWGESSDDQTSIYNRRDGFTGVGLENATEKVHVIGNLRVDPGATTDTGKIQTATLCDETENDCFVAEHLGGEEASDTRLKCDGDNYHVMRGIRLTNNADAASRELANNTGCIPVVGIQSTNCGSGLFSFMTGITVNAQTGNLIENCDNIP